MGGRTWLTLALGVTLAVFLAGCSNSTSTSPSGAGLAPVSMTIHDTPPTGVSILSFEIHITGASLQPSGSGQAVSLMSAPDEIELEHLQTSSALLGSTNVPAGTYSSLTVTFANPQITILNDTGSTLTVGGTSCANGQVCELQPALNQASVTVGSSPLFPLTLSATSGVTLQLDFNINSSVQSDLSVTPTVTVSSANSSMQNGSDGQEDMELVGVVGTVDTSNQSFTLQTGLNNQTDTILTTSNTEFGFAEAGCAANNFGCLAPGQVVKVEAQMANGQLTATEVDPVALPNTAAVMGMVVSVNATQNQFEMVLNDIQDSQDSATLGLGLPVMVTVSSGATFNLGVGGINLPSGLTFAGFANLMVGQEVSAAVSGLSTSNGSVTMNTSQVTLEASELSGTIQSVDSGNGTFVLTNLSPLFTANGITQILVQTDGNTQFEDVAGLSSLSTTQNVSVSGALLENGTSSAELLATAVRLRLDN